MENEIYESLHKINIENAIKLYGLEAVEKYINTAEILRNEDGYFKYRYKYNLSSLVSLYKLENSNDDKEKQKFFKEALLFLSKDYDYYLEKKRKSLDEDVAKGFMEIFEEKNWEESIDKLKTPLSL